MSTLYQADNCFLEVDGCCFWTRCNCGCFCCVAVEASEEVCVAVVLVDGGIFVMVSCGCWCCSCWGNAVITGRGIFPLPPTIFDLTGTHTYPLENWSIVASGMIVMLFCMWCNNSFVISFKFWHRNDRKTIKQLLLEF